MYIVKLCTISLWFRPTRYFYSFCYTSVSLFRPPCPSFSRYRLSTYPVLCLCPSPSALYLCVHLCLYVCFCVSPESAHFRDWFIYVARSVKYTCTGNLNSVHASIQTFDFDAQRLIFTKSRLMVDIYLKSHVIFSLYLSVLSRGVYAHP